MKRRRGCWISGFARERAGRPEKTRGHCCGMLARKGFPRLPRSVPGFFQTFRIFSAPSKIRVNTRLFSSGPMSPKGLARRDILACLRARLVRHLLAGDGLRDAGLVFEGIGLVGGFPGEGLFVAAEVAE